MQTMYKLKSAYSTEHICIPSITKIRLEDNCLVINNEKYTFDSKKAAQQAHNSLLEAIDKYHNKHRTIRKVSAFTHNWSISDMENHRGKLVQFDENKIALLSEIRQTTDTKGKTTYYREILLEGVDWFVIYSTNKEEVLFKEYDDE